MGHARQASSLRDRRHKYGADGLRNPVAPHLDQALVVKRLITQGDHDRHHAVVRRAELFYLLIEPRDLFVNGTIAGGSPAP